MAVPEQRQVLRPEPNEVHDRARVRERRSTAWFAGKLGRLVSVEHNPGWYERVRARLASENLTNVDYRLIPLDHPESDPERAEYATVPRYVAVADEFPDDSLDFVLVDGHYRTNCIRRCLGKLRPAVYSW